MKKKRKKEKKLPALLLEDIINLGQKGEIVNVKPGYFRYLVNQKKAVLADKKKLTTELKPLLLTEKVKSRENLAQKLKEEIEKLNLDFKLNKYTSITKDKIIKVLRDRGIVLSKNKIELASKINQPGEYILPVKLGYHITAHLKVIVKN
jgi:large subunit ribosomal protein L9